LAKLKRTGRKIASDPRDFDCLEAFSGFNPGMVVTAANYDASLILTPGTTKCQTSILVSPTDTISEWMNVSRLQKRFVATSLLSPYGIGQTIIFSSCGFYLSIYLFFLA